jgi:hypothetical protein
VGHFLIFYLESELAFEAGKDADWPFNEAYMTSADPAIVNVENVALPWRADKQG